MLNNLFAMFAKEAAIFGVRIALAAVALACVIFIIVVVMMQSGNSDGTEAFMGGSKNDDSESYYGKNASSRKERRLKLGTYICAGLLAVCCIVFIILSV